LAIAGSRPTVASKGQNRGLASPSLRPDQKKQAPVPGAPCTGAPGFRSKVARQSKQGASPWPVLRRPAGGGSIRRQAATRTMSGTPKQIRKRLQKRGGSDQERTVRLRLGAPLNDAGKGTQNWAPMRCQTQGGFPKWIRKWCLKGGASKQEHTVGLLYCAPLNRAPKTAPETRTTLPRSALHGSDCFHCSPLRIIMDWRQSHSTLRAKSGKEHMNLMEKRVGSTCSTVALTTWRCR